jgi:very-short-patch-repair endonuclease
VSLSPAAALVRVPQGVLSHTSAALVHGVPLVEDPAQIHVTVPRSHGHLALAGARLHRRPLPELDVQLRSDGTRVTTVERTLADVARILPLSHAVAAADGALRAGSADVDALRRRLRAERGTGSSACRAVADLLDPACESVLESLVRVLLWTGPWARPATQHRVAAPGGPPYRLDFAWPDRRLAVEADGFAFHSDRQAYRSDRRRHNSLVSLGWRVLRFTYEDAVARPDYVRALVGTCLELNPPVLSLAA